MKLGQLVEELFRVYLAFALDQAVDVDAPDGHYFLILPAQGQTRPDCLNLLMRFLIERWSDGVPEK